MSTDVLLLNLTRFGDLLQSQPLIQDLHDSGHQIGLVEHDEEHGEEEHQKAVAEALVGHPAGRNLVPGPLELSPQHRKELAPTAEVVAKELVASEDREDQG